MITIKEENLAIFWRSFSHILLSYIFSLGLPNQIPVKFNLFTALALKNVACTVTLSPREQDGTFTSWHLSLNRLLKTVFLVFFRTSFAQKFH